ncbi:hypothetical protein Aazo_3588 ['Nostoc azollae' 0708]|jgi:hypothetical protein|uniref:Uncharacterized protein n=1 Tax=Nostoc azollae (strain 0708) TaxID=551115 RepID=D7E3K8_NOSA0|nr:hypothetical protein Aazo_3588 ['Nostoc azollae' 0708]
MSENIKLPSLFGNFTVNLGMKMICALTKFSMRMGSTIRGGLEDHKGFCAI